MTLPLVYRHGAAETVFIMAVLVWVVFEAVMRAGIVLIIAGIALTCDDVWAAEIQSDRADFPADLGAGE